MSDTDARDLLRAEVFVGARCAVAGLPAHAVWMWFVGGPMSPMGYVRASGALFLEANLLVAYLYVRRPDILAMKQ